MQTKLKKARFDLHTSLPRDESCQLASSDGSHHHWHGFGRREPIGIVVSTSVVANVIEIAEQEWHRVELLETTSRRACEKWKD